MSNVGVPRRPVCERSKYTASNVYMQYEQVTSDAPRGRLVEVGLCAIMVVSMSAVVLGCRPNVQSAVARPSAMRFSIAREADATGRETVTVRVPTESLTDVSAPCLRFGVLGGEVSAPELQDAHLSFLCANARQEAESTECKNYVVVAGPVERADRKAWLVYIAASLTDVTIELCFERVDDVQFDDRKTEMRSLVLKANSGYALDFGYSDDGKKVHINKVLRASGKKTAGGKSVGRPFTTAEIDKGSPNTGTE